MSGGSSDADGTRDAESPRADTPPAESSSGAPVGEPRDDTSPHDTGDAREGPPGSTARSTPGSTAGETGGPGAGPADTPDAADDAPTPPRGTPAPAEVPAWDPGAGERNVPRSASGFDPPGAAGPGISGSGVSGSGVSGSGVSGPGPAPGPPGPGAPAGFTAPPGPQPGRPGGFGAPPRAPKPGIVPLRPLGLGELLDGALTYIRAHPRVVLGTSAVVAVVAQLVQVPLRLVVADAAAGAPDLAALLGLAARASATALIGGLITLVATAVLTGMLMVVISRAVLGAPVDAGECWRAARSRVPGLLGLVLLLALIGVGIVAVALAPGLLLLAVNRVAGVLVIALGVVGGLVALVWVGVALSLSSPAYVLEGIGVLEALRRSWFLVHGRFWPVLGIQVLAGLIVAVIGSLLAAPFTVAAAALGAAGATTAGAGGAATIGLPALLIAALGAIVATTLTAPFQSGVTGLLYVDQRMRREGFDIELQRAAAGGR